jgi:hypothetical protein
MRCTQCGANSGFIGGFTNICPVCGNDPDAEKMRGYIDPTELIEWAQKAKVSFYIEGYGDMEFVELDILMEKLR